MEDSGSMLEIGCGNGSFIKTFSSFKPNWKLAGTEFDDRNKFKIEKIKNTTFFSGNFTQINRKYDLIVCIHVLEHIYSPSEFLMNCDLMLNTNGKILIQVPNIDKSPFDIFIADHCSHFSIESLSRLVIKSGLRILEITSSVVDKEITLLIEKNNNEKHIQITSTYYYDFLNLVTRIDRLFLEEKFILGIFGSSIAATMLYSSLTSKINFFVDEDVNKIGNNHFNIPIISVDEIPKNSIVVLPMSNENAISISNRLKNKNFRFLY